MAYNTSVQPSTGYTPFFLMFDWQARVLADVMYGAPTFSAQSVNQYAATLSKQLDSAFALAWSHSLSSHLRQKELKNVAQQSNFVWLHSSLSKRGVNKKLYHP